VALTILLYQTSQTVDASYRSLANAIEFPTVLLQPPFFDPRRIPVGD
jgi:predicted metalloendopeptidase